MIWQFGEVGYDISIDYNGRLGKKPIKWNYLNELNRKNIYNTWSYLVSLRKKHSIFSDPQSKIDTWLNSSIKKIQYSLGEENAILITNFDVKTLQTSVSLPSAGHWYHATLGEKIYVEDNELVVSIPAGTFLLMTDFEIDYLPKGQAKLSVEEIIMPKSLRLHSNYPNPFNPKTVIRYDLPKEATVKILIYDMLGRLVTTLADNKHSAGFKQVHWDATNRFGKKVSAGLYLYTIQADDFRQTKKMILLK